MDHVPPNRAIDYSQAVVADHMTITEIARTMDLGRLILRNAAF